MKPTAQCNQCGRLVYYPTTSACVCGAQSTCPVQEEQPTEIEKRVWPQEEPPKLGPLIVEEQIPDADVPKWLPEEWHERWEQFLAWRRDNPLYEDAIELCRELATQVEKTKVVEQADIARCVGATAAEIERLQGQLDAAGNEINRLNRILTQEIDAHNRAKDEVGHLRQRIHNALVAATCSSNPPERRLLHAVEHLRDASLCPNPVEDS